MTCSSQRKSLLGGVLALAVWAAAAWAGAAEPGALRDMPIYVRSDSLQQTLLSTRARYRDWLEQQPAVRQAVRFEPWRVAGPLPAADADRLVRPAEGIDLTAAPASGPATWSPRPDLVDGKVVNFVSGSGGTAVYLLRLVQADRAARLTVGIGGGERLDVWLNGTQVAAAETHLTSGRYGCSYQVDGTRVDQVLVDLDLKAGENLLVARLVPGSDPAFYFSPSPNPVPRLWERVRCDFPAAQHPLLDLVPADWFPADGWFAAGDSERERSLIERLAADCGTDAAAMRAAADRLRQENADRDDRRWLDLCVKASVLAKLRTDLARLRAAVEDLGRSHPAEYPSAELLARLDEFERRLAAQAGAGLDPADEATQQLLAEMPRLRRELLVERNPLLRNAELLFVKRYTYNSKHYYDDFLHISRFGGNLCVLSLADGTFAPSCRSWPAASSTATTFRSTPGGLCSATAPRNSKVSGSTKSAWTAAACGRSRSLRTMKPRRIARYGRSSESESWYGSLGYQFWTDDLHPCYLPDGGICFASTRCEHGVLCTPAHYLACTNLFRIDAAGGGLRPLSQGRSANTRRP